MFSYCYAFWVFLILMIVRLSELDTYEIAWAAHERHKYKQDWKVKTQRVDQKRDDFAITREGMAGEWAVGKIIDTPVNLELHQGGDQGYDFEYRGVKIDVKTSRARYLLFRSLAHFKADLAVFARYLNDYQVELVGAITRAEFVAVHQLKNFGYGDNCVVDPLLLNDVRDYL